MAVSGDGTSEIQMAQWTVLANDTGPGDIDNDTPGAYEFIPVELTRLVAVAFIATTTIADDTTPATIKVYKRPTAGSASNQVQIGLFTLPSNLAAGKVAMMYVGAELPAQTVSSIDSSKLNTSPASEVDALAVPGESFYFVVDNDSTTGAGSFAYLAEKHGLRDDDDNVTLVDSDTE